MNDTLNDLPLTALDIRELENPDEMRRFFAKLHYNVDTFITGDHDLLNLGSEDLRQQIRVIYKIATDPLGEEIEVYLFEVRSVTVALRQAIARRFRTRGAGNLLILTRLNDCARVDWGENAAGTRGATPIGRRA